MNYKTLIISAALAALAAAPQLASAQSYYMPYGYGAYGYAPSTNYGIQSYGSYGLAGYLSQYMQNNYVPYSYSSYAPTYGNEYGGDNNLYAGWSQPHYNCDYHASYYICY